MSSVVNKITFYFIISLSLFSCNKQQSTYLISPKPSEQFKQDVKHYKDENDMVYGERYGNFSERKNENNDKALSANEIDVNLIQINKMEYNPTNVVDNLLIAPTRRLNVAIIAPLSGQYSALGNMVAESAMLAVSKSKYNNSGSIKIYSIGQLAEKNWKDNKEVKRLIEDDNDVIIGSFFADTTEKLLSILPENKLFISFINNNDLAERYANLLIASMDDSYKVNSFFQYLKYNKRKFVSLILPATKKGYTIEKLFRKLAPYYDVIVVGSQFYQSASRPSILASVRGINKTFSATYFVDKRGKLTTETYKASLAKKNKQLEETELKTQDINVNAIYIDANESDLTIILNGLERVGILNKDVNIFSNTIVDPQDITLKYDNLYYIGYNYDMIDRFNKQFNSYFGHNPNYTAYMTYDIISMLYFNSNEGKMLPKNFYNANGYRGVLDDFRFTREGSMERRFSIYKLHNKNLFRVFVPEDYFPLDITKSNGSLQFE